MSVRSDSSGGFYSAAAEEFPEEDKKKPPITFSRSTLAASQDHTTPPMEDPLEVSGRLQALYDSLDQSEKIKSFYKKSMDQSDRLHSFYDSYFKHRRSPKLGHGVMAKIFRKYPRSYACTFGIIIPVWILVLLSLLFGKFLGELEAGGELDNNDQTMRARKVTSTYNQAVKDTLNSLPTFCYMLYKNKTEPNILKEKFVEVLDESASLEEWIEIQPNLTGNTIVNVSKFATFMDLCGEAADNYTEDLWKGTFGPIMADVDGDDDPTLSFNWNRCLDQNIVNYSSTSGSNQIFIPTTEELRASRPAQQRRTYKDVWNADFDRLHQEYLSAGRENSTLEDFRLDAFNRSLYEATGRNTCVVNVAGSAWFWFTIMTTVGYGNQAPSSVGGRAMSFTAGFLCILLFGAVLATTGTIISLIVFDIVFRLKLKLLQKKQVMMLIWGLLWCAWMVGMSYMFITWSKSRLDADLEWQDAYWFSYISTTTVGLGDFYQAPQVLFIADLLAFSLSYLFGFVLLSTFLAELGQLLGQNLPDLSIELGKRLLHVAPGIVADDTPLDESQKPANSAAPSQEMAAARAPISADIDTQFDKYAGNSKDDSNYIDAYDGIETRA